VKKNTDKSREQRQRVPRLYIDNSWILATPTSHIILTGGWYRIRDPQEVLLTETRPLEGLEGLDTKLPSVDAIPVCSMIVE
jgi:hypothetical protein